MKRKDHSQNDSQNTVESQSNHSENDSWKPSNLLKLTPEEEIASYIEEAKERLELLAKKKPSIGIPDEDMLRRIIILRSKRGLNVNEIAKRLHMDATVVTTVAKAIPRRKDPSFPIEDWEAELAQEMANIPSMTVSMMPPARVAQTGPSPEQVALLRQIYGRPSAPTVMPIVSLQPVTVSKLQALALLDGGMDLDLWVNQRLIPWYLMSEKIKRKLNLPDEAVIDPNEFLKFLDMVISENVAFRKIFSDAQQLMNNLSTPIQQEVITK